jgi:hypothetical protein
LNLSITQQPINGILGGPKHKGFAVSVNNTAYNISIDQQCQREVSISSPAGKYEDATSIYYSLVTLLMLFDGHFYPVVNAYDGTDITESWNKRALPSYSSADFMLGTGNKLIEFDQILDAQLLQNWCALKKELDLVHNMVLYCLSSVEMPKDMQVAFMTEAFKGVCELIHVRNPNFALPLNSKNKLELKAAFLAVVDQYGLDIFKEELSRNKEGFAQVLVNSRNRIAHIKSRQNKRVLDGGESVMYLMKLSLMYRIVLFDLLGISKSVYDAALSSRVQTINNHKIMKAFLNSL